jgi:2-oxo-4-hydroxy-4-carboxy--5-ureidoimidazoline (OHCU) decarboxylase
MLKEFLMRKMLKSQMKGVPEAEQERIMTLVEKNPELFLKIAQEVQAEMKSGKDQMTASMAVMKRHEEELKKVMG